MSESETTEVVDENKLIALRREKLTDLRHQGQAYPNHYKREDLSADLQENNDCFSKEELAEKNISANIAGRMMFKREMGKASFAKLQDMAGQLQIYVRQDAIGEENYSAFKHSDIGDIFGAEGVLFKTQTGELSLIIFLYDYTYFGVTNQTSGLPQ